MFRGTINKDGRPKGSLNKNTEKVRNAFTQLVENNLDQLEEDIKQMKPGERVKTILSLSKFILPVLKAEEIVVEENKNTSWIDEFTEEDLEKIFYYDKNK